MKTPEPTGEYARHTIPPYPTQAELLAVLVYDPQTGTLRHRLDSPVQNPHATPIRFTTDGVPVVRVLGRTLRANRVCFTLSGRTLSRLQWVKHLNGRTMDFRASNLSAADHRERTAPAPGIRRKITKHGRRHA